MRLTGACSNLDGAGALKELLERKRQLARTTETGALSAQAIRLPQGAIQAAVLEVLRVAHGSLRVAEIHMRAEEKLGQAVSRDTVASFLSVACRADAPMVLRVERGVYTVDR